MKQDGFSITEILIALIIVGILAVILTPNLSSYVLRANRADAVKSLMAMQIAQEKYRLTHPTYAATTIILEFPSVSMDGYYNMAVISATATAYTLTATAIGTQTTDTACTTLTLTYANNATETTPAICWQ